jgi:rubrerythrin
MTILNLLNILEKLETGMMNVYQWFFKQFKESDPIFARFFLKMSNEEMNHKNLINYQKNLVRKNPLMFDNVDVDLNEIEMMIKLTEDILNEKPVVSKKSALDFAIKMESFASEGLYKKAIVESCPSLKDLIDSLTKEDYMHYKRLTDYYKKEFPDS